jgi:amino acid transporter
MSMRYFTLSAVCMLIFCMLLALSGTTDFPGTPHEIVPPSTAPGLSHAGVGEAMASVYPLPEASERNAGPGGKDITGGGVTGNRPLLLLGFVLVVAWVFLSFRLFSHSKN